MNEKLDEDYNEWLDIIAANFNNEPVVYEASLNVF